MFKSIKGITLIVLIITIIVLLVLAGVTINMVLGENGLFNNAKTSVGKYKNEQEKENATLDQYENLIFSILGSREISKEELKVAIREVLQEDFGTPVGEIIAQMGKTAPSGYLICDGKNDYLISEYTNLANYIEEQFGSKNYFGGDGTTTFGVPDLRGEFLRGTGTATRNTGTGEEVGTHQDATNIPNFIPYYNTSSDFWVGGYKPTNSAAVFVSGIDRWGERSEGRIYIRSANGGGLDTNATNSISYTSRPTNTSVLYCIKY